MFDNVWDRFTDGIKRGSNITRELFSICANTEVGPVIESDTTGPITFVLNGKLITLDDGSIKDAAATLVNDADE